MSVSLAEQMTGGKGKNDRREGGQIADLSLAAKRSNPEGVLFLN